VGQQRVRVVVERSGGLAGRTLPPTALDTTDLSPLEADRVRMLVADADVEALPTVSRTPQGRDMWQYDVTIQRGEETRRLRCDDGSVPSTLRPLLDFVLERGQPA
jgi:hypothetical protein